MERKEAQVEGYKFFCCDKPHTIEHVVDIKVTPVFNLIKASKPAESVALELTRHMKKLGYDEDEAEQAIMEAIASSADTVSRKDLLRMAIARI
jgi:Holliday junction resolvasome RuvABC DNA-binding subunit